MAVPVQMQTPQVGADAEMDGANTSTVVIDVKAPTMRYGNVEVVHGDRSRDRSWRGVCGRWPERRRQGLLIAIRSFRWASSEQR